MAEIYTIYVKDPKTGETKKVSFGKRKQEEKNYTQETTMDEDINVPVKIGDTVLMGRFKNKKVVVKSIGKDEHGMPTINGKKVVNFRKLKEGIEVTFDGDDKKQEREPKKLGNKDVGELLNEIIDADSINVDQLKIKDKMNPDVWDSEDKMNSEVRQALLKNALEFIKFSKLETAKFKDIILTGSLANYNWHEGSDLDVHVLMDYDQISDDNELVSDYFKTKKSLWGRLPIKVKGYDVELYVQDINEPHASTGVYSILNDKWVTKPIKTMIAIDIPNIKAKAMDFMNKIDDLESNVNIDLSIDEIDKLMDKLKAYRKAGLDDEGEFSTENLVFKVLRNTGYLEKLSDLKENVLIKSLTLENVSMYDPNISDESIDETNLGDKIKNTGKIGTISIGLVVALLASGISAEQAIKTFGIPQNLVQKAEKFIENTYEKLNIENKINY